ncbi:unnamed protein product [Rotaria socialis]|uniref:EGF-like domain-containing protein n=1 Tax=Rotaria socialis TaxID=392032 RepID=A0A821TM70_9BILA|nr:unnamed protein product [Rotaria socialis]CAF4878054.1 unnamed protein product [Rotaria socialis]
MADDATCFKNITACLNSFDLKLCDVDKDICFNRGYCVTAKSHESISACVCYPCYGGQYCQDEAVSNNLWFLGLPMITTRADAYLKMIIFVLVLTMQIFNSLLCLQTYLCSKIIRETNAGVYLILSSLCSLLFSLLECILSILAIFSVEFPNLCLIQSKHVLPSLGFIWNWLILCIAFEYMLVAWFNYFIFDSRKRSLIVASIIIVLCPLTTVPGIFTVRAASTDLLTDRKVDNLIGCINYTPSGYIINKIITSIHYYGPILLYNLLILIVFIKLLRHRDRFVRGSTNVENIRLILSKHHDFFIPVIVLVFCGVPLIVLNEIMTCEKAMKSPIVNTLLKIFEMIGFIPVSVSFIFHIYLNNVYMYEFRHTSIVGKFFVKLKCKCRLTKPPRTPNVADIQSSACSETSISSVPSSSATASSTISSYGTALHLRLKQTFRPLRFSFRKKPESLQSYPIDDEELLAIEPRDELIYLGITIE